MWDPTEGTRRTISKAGLSILGYLGATIIQALDETQGVAGRTGMR